MTNRQFAACFDHDKIKSVLDVTLFNDQSLLALLGGSPNDASHLRKTVAEATDVYLFSANLTLDDIEEFIKDRPTEFAKLIKKNGKHL